MRSPMEEGGRKWDGVSRKGVHVSFLPKKGTKLKFQLTGESGVNYQNKVKLKIILKINDLV